MAAKKLSDSDLKRELDDFRSRYPVFADDQLFVVWFLRACLTEDEKESADSLCGGASDKGLDAVMIDPDTKNVFIVQGKYHKKIGEKNEHRPDVTSFAQLALTITGDNKTFSDFNQGLSPEAQNRVTKARKHIFRDGYRLRLYYVTTGKCSTELAKEADRIVRSAQYEATCAIIDGRQILLLLSDYLDGVAPPVPSLDLEMEAGEGIQVQGIFHRYDGKTQIESWVFSMTSHDVAKLYEQAGNRLFARNVRGFLGSTEINQGMERTLKNEPDFFWYYNNGITIICDHAEEISSQGKKILRVANPQVINGQQTTRTLARWANRTDTASVSVRVIRVPRNANRKRHSEHFETLVSQIVSATNWQNSIRQSDLMSNDRRQIEIERQLRKCGYWYIRKRQTHAEAKRVSGTQRFFYINKETLAQSVAGCDLDPSIVRKGKEGLFEERQYGQVFPTSDPYYYLPRYWLMREVGAAAQGYPERAYAKWLVLNFVWSRIVPFMRSKSRIERFKYEWETNNNGMYYLWRLNTVVFNAALRFYRIKRGKGAKAQDISTFFQRRNLHNDFKRYWRGSFNKSRPAFHNTWKKLIEIISEDRAS